MNVVLIHLQFLPPFYVFHISFSSSCLISSSYALTYSVPFPTIVLDLTPVLSPSNSDLRMRCLGTVDGSLAWVVGYSDELVGDRNLEGAEGG
jgi:hypothetical protein